MKNHYLNTTPKISKTGIMFTGIYRRNSLWLSEPHGVNISCGVHSLVRFLGNCQQTNYIIVNSSWVWQGEETWGTRGFEVLRLSETYFFSVLTLTFLRRKINGFGGVLVLFFQNFFPVLSHKYLQNTQMTCVGGRGRDRVYGTQATDERLAEPLLLSISNTVVLVLSAKSLKRPRI